VPVGGDSGDVSLRGAHRMTPAAHRENSNPIALQWAMVTRLRIAVAMLLLLALPLQGFAAATMLVCGPGHHRTSDESASSLGATPDDSAIDEHHHDSIGASGADSVTAPASVANDGLSVHHFSKHSDSTCGACGACCVGAALPKAAPVYAFFAPAILPSFSVAAPHVRFCTNGPDRPPRLLLA